MKTKLNVGNATIIELNGKKYDANTGRVISDSGWLTSKIPSSPKPSKSSSRVLDGVWLGSKRKKQTPGNTKQPTQRSAAAPHKRKTQKASTLMRSAVKSPVKSSAPSTGHILDGISKAASKGRLSRSKQVGQSAFIGRFNPPAATPVIVSRIKQPVAKAAAAVAAAAAPAISATMPARNHFEKALEKATSHTAKPLKKKVRIHHRVAKKLGVKPKTVSLSTVILAVLLTGGFWFYQNLPRFAIRVAAARAGFSASLPAYQPSGFSLDSDIHYKNGLVTLNYRSTSDDRSYEVSQQPSLWNSESLLNNYVAKDPQTQYQTVQNNGKTVYFYGSGNAAFVDGGKLWDLKSNGNLDNEQILDVLNSL